MYVNDPSELAELPEVVSDIEFEEARDYHEFFWDDINDPNYGNHVGYQRGVHTQICRFNSNGEHTYMADDCPHFELADEMGRNIQKGWTVQQR